MYIIETNNLGKDYKGYKALNNLNIHIEDKAIYGLVGKNGAGKTTLIRIICGLQEPSNGTYAICGIDYRNKEILNVRKRIGAIIERPSIYEEMTAEENLITQMKLLGKCNYKEIDKLVSMVGLSKYQNKKAKYYSLGMKQRLGIAVALVSKPNLLILDEPINGLDPGGIIEIRELILKLNKENNITLLISSHYLDELSKIATHYGFLDNGTIIKEIAKEDLISRLKSKIELEVNTTEEFIDYFKKNDISYEISSDKIISIDGKYNLQKLLTDFTNNNLKVEKISKKEESLEDYYMNLIGGSKHD